jgi:hypothetical protein
MILKGEKEKIEGDNVLHTTLLKECNQYRIWLTINNKRHVCFLVSQK